jgi:putative peptidoglycan lipid II flippase
VTDQHATQRTVRIVVSAAWVIGLSIVAKMLGLFKDVAVAARFGTTGAMDAFLVAFTIPTLIVSWFQSPIRSGFIPLFTESIEKDGEEQAWRGVGTFVGDLMLLITVLTGVAIVAAPALVRAVAPGFDPEKLALAVSLTRIMLLSVVAGTFGGLLTNLLHCYGNFALPGFGNPLNNLMLIGAAVFLTATYGVRGLAWGVVAGSVAQALVQWPIVWRNRARFKLGFDLRNPMFLGVMRLAFPLFIGMAGAKLDDVVDRVFASKLAEGSISALGYALRLIELPREIVVLGLATVLFPFFSNMVAKGRIDEFGDKFVASLRIAFFLLLPVSVAFAMFGEPIVRIVLQRGAFDEQSVGATLSALILYAPTIWALGITSIMISGLVALKDTKTPVIVGFVRLGVKVALMFALVAPLQHLGVALSTSLSHIFKFVLFLFVLPACVRKGRYPGMFKSFAGAAAATAVMAAAIYLVLPFVGRASLAGPLTHRLAALGGGALLGIAVYAGAAYLLARKELTETLNTFKDGFQEIFKKKRPLPVEAVDIE